MYVIDLNLNQNRFKNKKLTESILTVTDNWNQSDENFNYCQKLF